ncbi:MAG: thioredoxin fold domain-containing protein [Balneolaceae bacterium]
MSIFSKIFVTGLFLILFLYQPVSSQALNAEPVSMREALERANSENKKILVDVYAEWCPYCGRMHSEVYPSEEVRKVISEYFLLVKINVESDNSIDYLGTTLTESEFANALENKSVPTTYFLNEEGSILGSQPGFLPIDVFSALLAFVGSDAYLNQTFEEYRNR